MKQMILIAAILLIPCFALAGSITARWGLVPDDSELSSPEKPGGGYRLYILNVKTQKLTTYEVGPGQTTMSETLRAGDYSAGLTAFDSDGNESAKAPVDENGVHRPISFTVKVGMPGGFEILIISK